MELRRMKRSGVSFAKKYRDLYNSVPYDENEMEEILCELNDRIPACRQHESGCYNIILSKHSATLNSSNLQFGFKKHHSTAQCTFVLQEVIQHCTQKGSTVRVTLLDASRAFYRVNYTKLFRLLLERRMCPTMLRLLLMMYTTQELNVRWNHVKSNNFNCTNDVKQGAVLSILCVHRRTSMQTKEIGDWLPNRTPLCRSSRLCR